jgi:starch synthase (maltosyl-transferring)
VLARIVIDDVRPRTPSGVFPPKAVVREAVRVSADVFRDGHDLLAGRVRWRPTGAPPSDGPGAVAAGHGGWQEAPLVDVGNDRWEAVLRPELVGPHEFVVEAWTDRFATWRRDVRAKVGAAQDVGVELEEGALLLAELAPLARNRALVEDAAAAVRSGSTDARLNAALDEAVAEALVGVASGHVTSSEPRTLWVDRERAVASAWYEFFPRSEGGLVGSAKRLAAVADMGFDVVYLPPIHPIGRTARKGPDNTLEPGPDDPGSPWAIGAEEGGHTEIHPDLGTIDDFDALVAEAGRHGVELALDYALQCSPDHPWVREHPEWFHHRPDGTIKYAENPPKKYQDIYPINFWPEDESDRVALWEACKAILDHWIAHGIRIFRVDNPHTKPMAFWAWLLPAVQAEHPDVLFLAEAFTRPKVMAKLAEVGFSQSYTYFTWRTTRDELAEYVVELTSGPTADYMRPNFWPNTPDILSGPLRYGSRPAFELRLVLAATLVPSYGVYSGYELMENLPFSEANEEYLRSEKYEVKARDWGRADSLAPLMTRLNDIRRRHPALRQLRGTTVHGTYGDAVLAYSRQTADLDDVVLCVVNLDPHVAHETTLRLDMDALGLPWGGAYEAHDELGGQTFTWDGPNPYVRLDPTAGQVAHVLHLRAR